LYFRLLTDDKTFYDVVLAFKALKIENDVILLANVHSTMAYVVVSLDVCAIMQFFCSIQSCWQKVNCPPNQPSETISFNHAETCETLIWLGFGLGFEKAR
jgi:hypothetical protein